MIRFAPAFGLITIVLLVVTIVAFVEREWQRAATDAFAAALAGLCWWRQRIRKKMSGDS